MTITPRQFAVRLAWTLSALALLLTAALVAWVLANPGVIGLWGIIAFVGCLLATFLLGGGLMALVFYSARAGIDDINRKDPPA
jgi:hypothetical protein